ncbi:MerT mercuric transport protein [compost metagenome]
MAKFAAKGSLITGVLAATAASVCCVGPLVLLTLGIGGAWVGSLTALEPYRPIFMWLTLLFLGLALRKLYLVPQGCAVGTQCTDRRTVKRQRLTFWIGTALLLGLLAVPWFVPLFYYLESLTWIRSGWGASQKRLKGPAALSYKACVTAKAIDRHIREEYGTAS